MSFIIPIESLMDVRTFHDEKGSFLEHCGLCTVDVAVRNFIWSSCGRRTCWWFTSRRHQ